MDKFNSLYKKIIESNTSAAVLGGDGQPYAAGDNRPITPANIVLGAKKLKNKKRKIPVQKRSFVEPIMFMHN